jgi:OOP family OmpA-OmpF porin
MRFFLLIIFFPVSFPAFSQGQGAEQFQVVNTPYDEQNPVLSPDGNTLYFTIGNHPANTAGKKDPGDIWISTKEGTRWTVPVHGGPLLNDRAYNAVAGFSPDGQQLFLHGHYSPGSIAKTQGISVSRNSGGTWSRPDNITIPYFLNKSGTLCGALSDDNTVFIFSAESYGTYGVDDIYVSLRQGGKWTEPKNLGASINTQFQELSPSLSADNRTLFFCSNGRKGNGSFDIFSTTRLDDSWTSWSTPVNMGPAINSDGRELYFRMYAPLGFGIYTSTKSSDGYGDMKVYVPDLPPLPTNDSLIYASLQRETVVKTADPAEDKVTEVDPPAKTTEINTEVKVFGKITSAKTGEALAARISFDGPDSPRQTATSGEDGYMMAVPSSAYVIRIEATGYISTMEKLNINAEEMREVEMNFKLQPVEVGTTVNLKNVLFAQAKTDILAESFSELDLVVSFVK